MFDARVLTDRDLQISFSAVTPVSIRTGLKSKWMETLQSVFSRSVRFITFRGPDLLCIHFGAAAITNLGAQVLSSAPLTGDNERSGGTN
jgi:hypothetical protein